MFVKLLCNLGARDYPALSNVSEFLEGTVHDVTDAVGLPMIRRGHALEVPNPNPAPEPPPAEDPETDD